MSAICFNLDQSFENAVSLQYESFENTVGKGEIAHNEQFLPFPTVFSTHLENFKLFFIKFKIVVCQLFQFGSLKFVTW